MKKKSKAPKPRSKKMQTKDNSNKPIAAQSKDMRDRHQDAEKEAKEVKPIFTDWAML